MFWVFLIAAATAIVLIPLGALSVWVTALSLASRQCWQLSLPLR